MAELIEAAVTRMLSSFGVKVTPERVEAFTEAVVDEELCERCGVTAAKNLTRGSKRVPFPVHLMEETKEVMASAEHAIHVADRKALTTGDLGTWWVTEGPVHVRAAWPELSSEQAIAVAQKMYDLGYIPPDATEIATDLGFVDDNGPSIEREWWLKTMPELTVVEDRRFV